MSLPHNTVGWSEIVSFLGHTHLCYKMNLQRRMSVMVGDILNIKADYSIN